MGGLAVMAKRLGHTVTGSDVGVYPPMSTQLEAEGIELMQGYNANNLTVKPDIVVIGNALSRGNEEVEAVLNSGPALYIRRTMAGRTRLKNRWCFFGGGRHTWENDNQFDVSLDIGICQLNPRIFNWWGAVKFWYLRQIG